MRKGRSLTAKDADNYDACVSGSLACMVEARRFKSYLDYCLVWLVASLSNNLCLVAYEICCVAFWVWFCGSSLSSVNKSTILRAYVSKIIDSSLSSPCVSCCTDTNLFVFVLVVAKLVGVA